MRALDGHLSACQFAENALKRRRSRPDLGRAGAVVETLGALGGQDKGGVQAIGITHEPKFGKAFPCALSSQGTRHEFLFLCF